MPCEHSRVEHAKGEGKMQPREWSVVLLASLLAAMAMVSAGNVVSSSENVGMKYFSDIPKMTKSQSIVPVQISEYSLVTVDSTGFMRDADNGDRLECTLDGQPYSIELTPVPSIIASGAKIYVKTNEGTTITDVPQIKQYKGRIIGNKTGDAFFTVDKDVILGRIKTGNESYFIDQSGLQIDGKIVHIVYNARNEVVRTKLPTGNDILPVTNLRSFLTVPEMQIMITGR